MTNNKTEIHSAVKRANKHGCIKIPSRKAREEGEIKYSCLEMAEYLLPFKIFLKTEEKWILFEIRNRMIEIPDIFSSKCDFKCMCGKIETMNHIYNC